MKLPFDLGVKLFFRLLLPGFLLTLGLSPLLFALLDIVRLGNQNEVAFVLISIFAGWLILSADMPIYMLLEGRRYWPAFLWRMLYKSEQNRLQKIYEEVNDYYKKIDPSREEELRYVEASVALRSFPIEKREGENIARLPTRLGNAIESFETYSKTRYELGAAFYWPRIWINLSKDLRDEIDNQQAMADSAVYSTFALACAGGLWVLYGMSSIIEKLLAVPLYKYGILHGPLGEGVFRYLPAPLTCFTIGAGSLLLSHVVYRVAVFSNEQFGAVFMAVIDDHVDKVNEYVEVDKIVKKVSAVTKVHADDEEKLEIVRRYLQYYNVKLPSRKRPVPLPKVRIFLNSTEEYSAPDSRKP